MKVSDYAGLAVAGIIIYAAYKANQFIRNPFSSVADGLNESFSQSPILSLIPRGIQATNTVMTAIDTVYQPPTPVQHAVDDAYISANYGIFAPVVQSTVDFSEGITFSGVADSVWDFYKGITFGLW